MKIVITGAKGLIGWHAAVRLHAQNCAAKFKGNDDPYVYIPLSHAQFDADDELDAAVSGSDAVLHFAGVNRADSDDIVEAANPLIAQRLIDACKRTGADPHIIYANSTHAVTDTPYGRSKKGAADILGAGVSRFTDMILPHIFGEGARPFYNNVTATFMHKVIAGDKIEPNKDGRVNLLYAGVAAQTAIDAALNGVTGAITPEGRPMSVVDLLTKIEGYHALYTQNIYPDVSDEFELALFNTYRAATYPDGWPRPLKVHSDDRGVLFEAVKGGGGGQTFLSTTKSGITRGDHFHLHKVERFLVVQGDAIIRVRKALDETVWEYKVSGDNPAPVDMPTLHTHSIENVGDTPLLTLFWTHDLFDPQNPDTFADKVLP